MTAIFPAWIVVASVALCVLSVCAFVLACAWYWAAQGWAVMKAADQPERGKLGF